MSVRFGFGVLHLFTLAFVVLKLQGTIDWSWWWVLLPSYGPATAVCSLVLIGALMMGVAWLMMTPAERARRRAADACKDLADALGRK